jgi:hypothetical protein
MALFGWPSAAFAALSHKFLIVFGRSSTQTGIEPGPSFPRPIYGEAQRSGSGARVVWHHLAEAIREFQRAFADASSAYRPELHYMRGPGPKWRARRAGGASAAAPLSVEVPALRGLAEVSA